MLDTQHFLWLSFILGFIIIVLVWLSVEQGKRHRNRQMFTGSPATTAGTDSLCVFDQTAFMSKNRVVLYYAPWSPYCTTFKPEFDKAASQAAAEGLDVCFVTVNVDSQQLGSQSTCLQTKVVTSFPTVQLETGVDPSPPYRMYNGLRNATDLLTWVKEVMG